MRMRTPTSIVRTAGVRAGLVNLFIAAAAIAATSSASAADGDLLKVYMDHARVLKLDRPVSKVIVGSSDIADVTVADPKTIVLTGKSYGTTNLVLLDQNGTPIVDQTVLVSIDEGNTVRVYRQVQRDVLSCSPICEKQTVRTAQPTATAQ